MRTEELRNNWNQVVDMFSARFADGDEMDLDAILFLIGVQEVGLGYKRYKKDDKVNLMHVAICRLLEPYGYYEYIGIDDDGWPHFKSLKELPNLKAGEQTILMKEAVVKYAKANAWI